MFHTSFFSDKKYINSRISIFGNWMDIFLQEKLKNESKDVDFNIEYNNWINAKLSNVVIILIDKS